MIMISNFIFNFINICVICSYFDNLLTLSISFSTVVRVPVVAELVILGISPLTSSILALREELIAKLVITDLSSSIFFILAFYTSFLTTSLFTTSLYLFKPTGTGTNL